MITNKIPEVNKQINSRWNHLLFNIVYVLTVLSLFLWNNDRTSTNLALDISLSFITFIFALILTYSSFSRIIVFSLNEFLWITILISISILTLFIMNFINLQWIYLIVAIYITKAENND